MEHHTPHQSRNPEQREDMHYDLFLNYLREHRLVPLEKLTACEAECRELFPDENNTFEHAKNLAGVLAARDALTSWQAAKVLSGESARLNDLNLGNFMLIDTIGSGGMGSVYVAIHRRLRTKVAIKISTFDDIERASRWFTRESQVCAELNHPGIPTVTELEKIGDMHYNAMEYKEGSMTLGAFVTKEAKKHGGSFPERLNLRITHDLLAILAYAHSRGVSHLDIKPSNILIAPDDMSHWGYRVILIDWGLCHVDNNANPSLYERVKEADYGADEEHAGVSISVSGQVAGTLDYMAPEQAAGREHVSPKSDSYAVAGVMYFMQRGQDPFAQEITKQSKYKRKKDHGVLPDPQFVSGTLQQTFDDLQPVDAVARADARTALQNIERRIQKIGLEAAVDWDLRRVRHRTRNRIALIGAPIAAIVIGGVALYYSMRPPDDRDGRNDSSAHKQAGADPSGTSDHETMEHAVETRRYPDVIELRGIGGIERINLQSDFVYQTLRGGRVWHIYDPKDPDSWRPQYRIFVGNKPDNFLVLASNGILFRAGSDEKIEFKENEFDADKRPNFQKRSSDPQLFTLFEQFGEPIDLPVASRSVRDREDRTGQKLTDDLLYVFANEIRRAEDVQGRRLRNRPSWMNLVAE